MSNPESVAIMRTIDGLSREQRALVYEYGFQAVARFVNDGYHGKRLKSQLRQWRQQRQQQ